MKVPALTGPRKIIKKRIIIDGCNIAYDYRGKIDLNRWRIALKQFENHFDLKEVIIWIKRSFQQYVKSNKEFNQLIEDLEEKELLEITPAGADDDEYLLSHAFKNKGFVITIDKYRKYIRKHPEYGSWLKTNRIEFRLIRSEGRFLFDPINFQRLLDKYGKKG